MQNHKHKKSSFSRKKNSFFCVMTQKIVVISSTEHDNNRCFHIKIHVISRKNKVGAILGACIKNNKNIT